ncbi:hypothetical protein WDW86_13190 [Bdellovibrionota bacterium FG-2]
MIKFKLLTLLFTTLISVSASAEPSPSPSGVPVEPTELINVPAPIASPRGLNFRASFAEFSKEMRVKRRALEEKWLKGERDFSDELRNALRIAEDQFAEVVAQSGDWKAAKRDFQKKKLSLIKELKQRVKIRREELELELIRVEREQDEAMRKLISELDTELKQFKKEKQFQKARDDFQDASADLKTELSQWKNRMKAIKMKEAVWE